MKGTTVALNVCVVEPLLLLSRSCLVSFMDALVQRLGLAEKSTLIVPFPGGGFTITATVAESHIALHTWDELSGFRLVIDHCKGPMCNDDIEQVITEFFKWHFIKWEVAQ